MRLTADGRKKLPCGTSMWTKFKCLNEALTAKRVFLVCVGVLLAFNESSHGQVLLASGPIDFKGNNLATDSFNSSAPDYPGYWTNSIRKARGGVITLSTITNAISIGNASIGGHVMTGPGGGISMGTNGSVGDIAWVDAGTPGIKPGWLSDDANFVLKNVVIPSPPQAIWTGAPGSGNMTIYNYTGTTITSTNSRAFSHVVTSSGNYTINDSGDIYVGSNCVVNLKVISSVGTFNPNMLYGAGTGTNAAKVTCYIDCPNATLGTDDKSQGGGLAGNMVFFGTINCTLLAYKGNGDFTGTLYFPQADFLLAGGGSGIIDFIGSCVVKTVQANGHYHFHFDEALYQQSLPIWLVAAPSQNHSVLVGQNTSLNGAAVGLLPLWYQWRFEGSNIPDATNSWLALTNIQMTNAGLYEVAVTNISGSATSQVQLAVFDSATPMLQSPAVSTDGVFQMAIAGVPDFKYAIEASTNLVDWVPITTNTSPYVFSDTNAVLLPQEFYRAVYVP
jgi:hypothetical protein